MDAKRAKAREKAGKRQAKYALKSQEALERGDLRAWERHHAKLLAASLEILDLMDPGEREALLQSDPTLADFWRSRGSN